MNAPGKIAVVMFNLGGPDCPQAVEPFLFNLFNDRAIIDQPAPLRWLLAKLISKRRAPVAQAIYEKMGGRSPILPETMVQAEALQTELQGRGLEAQTFVAMRYWHPRADAVARSVREYAPDEIVLLPLYPQFSTTTTRSSLDEWHRAAERVGLSAPTHTVCCYPAEPGFIAAQTALLLDAISQVGSVPYRVLFSAHGLPKRTVDKTGDPYPAHVALGAEAIARAMAAAGTPLADWRVSFQSRVGPLEWIGPATEDEIRLAGDEGKALVVLPLAFVSEHSETLVELDIEYRDVADEAGVPAYVRVPTVGIQPAFIGALATVVAGALAGKVGVSGANACPADHRACPAAKGQ